MRRNASLAIALAVVLTVAACAGYRTLVTPDGQPVKSPVLQDLGNRIYNMNLSLAFVANSIADGVEAGLISPEARDKIMPHYDDAVEALEKAETALEAVEAAGGNDSDGKVANLLLKAAALAASVGRMEDEL